MHAPGHWGGAEVRLGSDCGLHAMACWAFWCLLAGAAMSISESHLRCVHLGKELIDQLLRCTQPWWAGAGSPKIDRPGLGYALNPLHQSIDTTETL